MRGIPIMRPALPQPGVAIGGGMPVVGMGGGAAAPVGFRGAMMITPAPQSIPNSTVQILAWATIEEDTDGYVTDMTPPHANGPNVRFTIPAGRGGLYLIGASIAWAAAVATPSLQLRIRAERGSGPANYAMNTRPQQQDETGGVFITQECCALIRLVPGNYLDVVCFHSTGGGGARNLDTANPTGRFWLVQVAAS